MKLIWGKFNLKMRTYHKTVKVFIKCSIISYFTLCLNIFLAVSFHMKIHELTTAVYWYAYVSDT